MIIIGTGAGGGRSPGTSRPPGKRILLLERGDWLTREPENWSTSTVFVDNRYVSPDTWYDEKGKAFQPGVHYFVGGATKLYGAALYRLRKEDFGELHHHDGISPAWPVSYDEFEPYYTLAEQHYEVHGARGEDPTEPPASAPYPHPAVSHEPRIQQLADQLEAAGYHPFHAPCGIMLDESNPPFSTCIRCATCDGFPCLVHAKSDAEVLGVRPALEHANVTLLTNRKVVRLDTDDAGTAVTEVVVDHDGVGGALLGRRGRPVGRRGELGEDPAPFRERQAPEWSRERLGSGRSQLHVPRLDRRPGSLARGEQDRLPEDARAQRLLLRRRRLRATRSGTSRWSASRQAPMFRGERPGETKLAPEWTLERMAKHAIDFWLSTEDLPRPDNRVSGRSATGTSCSPTGDECRGEEAALHEGQVAAREAGHEPRPPDPPVRLHEERHPGRRLRASGGNVQVRDRSGGTSVLDTDCRAHEVDNLYVVDTSFFPSIGAVNPALTAMANALRVGDHLLERLGAKTEARVSA